MSDLHNIDGVEIFRTGRWNNDSYDTFDLDEMVSNFDRVGYRVPVKIGHSDDSAEPAAGWARRVYRVGGKLVADLTDVPRAVYEAIRRRAYDAISSEIFWDLERNGKKYRRALKAIALLGAAVPAVSDLRPLRSVVAAISPSAYGRLAAHALPRSNAMEDDLTYGMAEANYAVDAAIREHMETHRIFNYAVAYKEVLALNPGLRRLYGQSGLPRSYLERQPGRRIYSENDIHSAGERVHALVMRKLDAKACVGYGEAIRQVLAENPNLKRVYAGC